MLTGSRASATPGGELGPQEHCYVRRTPSHRPPVSGASAPTKANAQARFRHVWPGSTKRPLGALNSALATALLHLGFGLGPLFTPLQTSSSLVRPTPLQLVVSTCIASQCCFCWRLLFLPPACCAALSSPPVCIAARATQPHHCCPYAPSLTHVHANPCAHQPKDCHPRPSLTLSTLKRLHSHSRRPRIARSCPSLGQHCSTRLWIRSSESLTRCSSRARALPWRWARWRPRRRSSRSASPPRSPSARAHPRRSSAFSPKVLSPRHPIAPSPSVWPSALTRAPRADRRAEAQSYAARTLQLALAVGVVLALLIGGPFAPWCVGLMGCPVGSPLHPDALAYARTRAFGLPAALAISASEGIFRGMARPLDRAAAPTT